MASQSTDREDLLREATALVERAELCVPGWEEPLIIGFRRDGSASFFLGADPVYQFNSAGELRRAYVGGLLYKAEKGRLVSLRRERSAGESALVRHELSIEETNSLLAAMQEQLGRLRDALAGGEGTILRQVPADSDVLGRIRKWLAALPQTTAIAAAPNVR